MADGMLDQVLGWLKGAPQQAPAQPPFDAAPPLSKYPSNDDAYFARRSGFSQGNVNQDFLDNNAANVIGFNFAPSGRPDLPTHDLAAKHEIFIPQSAGGLKLSEAANAVNDPSLSSRVDMTNPENYDLRHKLQNTFMRAALAVNRNPIAAVGFDPNRVAMDTQVGPATVGGIYSNRPDSIYSNMDTNVDPQDSIVHESTHRGLQKLRELYPDQAKAAMGHLPSEETIVRWLMNQTAGDPEGGAGPVDAKQRQQAITYFNGPMSDDGKSAISQLQELAIQRMKDRGKRAGPQ